MIIKNLKLNNFRNYSSINVDFLDQNNIIYGLNGGGKTNLIESIYFLSIFKSFRTNFNKELIKENCDFSIIESNFVKNNRDYTLEIKFSLDNKYEIHLNGVKYTRNNLLANIKCVVFSPDDLYLVKDSPEARRKFLNDTLIQFRPKYGSLIRSYNKFLKEKNAILKKLDEKPEFISVLHDYNLKLIELSAEISSIRANFLILLNTEAQKIYSQISQNREELEIFYDTKLINAEKDVFNNKKQYESLFKSYFNKEIISKSSLIGIHKDDISFKLSEKNAKTFASQGQIRSIILSLKLATRELFFKDTSYYPILILDDVLSELDKTRQDFILKNIKNGQIFITSPEINTDIEGKLINIKDGEVF